MKTIFLENIYTLGINLIKISVSSLFLMKNNVSIQDTLATRQDSCMRTTLTMELNDLMYIHNLS